MKNRSNPDISMRPIECTVEPGSILFVPHGWWHTVLNLDDNSVALTQNYVSASNLPDVLRFLDSKKDHISGCRDRADAVKPETFKSEFVNVLQLHRPDLLKTAQKVEGWTCKAWSDNSNRTSNNKLGNVRNKAEDRNSDDKSIINCSIVDKAKQKGGGTDFSFAFTFC